MRFPFQNTFASKLYFLFKYFVSTDCTDCNNKKSGHPPVRGGGFSPETFKHDFSLLGVILERSTKLDFLGCFGLRIGCQLTIYMNITIIPRHSQKLAPLMCFQALIAARSYKNKRNIKGAYALGKPGTMQLRNRQCQIFLNVLF